MTRSTFLIALWLVLWSVARADAQQATPRLGSPMEPFVARFGPPFRANGTVQDFDKCPGRSAEARWSVMFEDGKAISIWRGTCGGAKHAIAEARRDAMRFFPPDAVRGKPFVTENGEEAERYVSQTLGKTLAPRHFENCDSKPVTRGTFLYVLSAEKTYWSIVAGLCP